MHLKSLVYSIRILESGKGTFHTVGPCAAFIRHQVYASPQLDLYPHHLLSSRDSER